METIDQQFLTFSIGDEQYALPVGHVREVLESKHITKLPRTDSAVKGIINVRGMGIPILDLGLLFGIDEEEGRKNSAIMIVEYEQEGSTHVIGLLCSDVHQVIFLDPEQFNETPKLGSKIASDCIYGIGRYDDKFILVLSLDEILRERELSDAIENMVKA